MVSPSLKREFIG